MKREKKQRTVIDMIKKWYHKIMAGVKKSSPNRIDEIHSLICAEKESEVLNILRTMPHVDLHSTYYYGHTILGSAAVWNAIQVVKYLIETAGMSVDFPSKWGITPLMDAACHCNFEIASYLVQHGANVNALSPQGDTPLIWAVDNAVSGGELSIVKLLIENGADKDYIQPSTGLSLIRIAELESRPDIVKYLASLEAGQNQGGAKVHDTAKRNEE